MSCKNFKSQKDYQEYWMRQALLRARRALSCGEVPVGALIVYEGKLLASSYNKKEGLNQATAHAEILAINKACKKLGSWRLSNASMFVTMEPCIMCSGALIQSRISKLYFGCFDPKAGALLSNWHIHNSLNLNHRLEVYGGILEKECSSLVQDFFKKRRDENKAKKRIK